MKELKKIKDQKGFTVPENYFSKFEDRLMSELSPKEEFVKKASWFDNLVYQLQLRFTIPASLVTAIALIIIFINLDQEEEVLTFSDAEIKNYLLEEYDEDVEESIYAMSFGVDENDLIMTDTEIMDYLYENDIDLEIIEEYIP